MIRIEKYDPESRGDIFDREISATGVESAVAEMIADVRRRGDDALREYAARFDGAQLDAIEVSADEIDAACAQVEPRLMQVLERAAANIRAFHSKQTRSGFVTSGGDGIMLGQRVLPIENVGVYVPGGRAAYPSTVLMDVIPAKIAGCAQICIMTPPGRDGKVAPAILAAARVAGADRVFRSGGAQGIAALAYGTAAVPKVDKIVGPGNAYVAEAKRQVFGAVAIDMIAGPSEILIVADGASDPVELAADMLSQAEHDPSATAVLVTDSAALAGTVAQELERQIALLPKQAIARASIDNNGRIIVAASIAEAIEISNALAPEHLELCLDDPFSYLGAVRNAGSVFMGRSCPEALGDYMAGPNHTLPTLGTARFSSPLSVDDFVKTSQFVYYSRDALAGVAGDVAYFADTEGLHAHAVSAEIRLRGREGVK